MDYHDKANIIACSKDDGRIVVWNVEDKIIQNEVVNFIGGTIGSIAIHPDGERIIAGYSNNWIASCNNPV